MSALGVFSGPCPRVRTVPAGVDILAICVGHLRAELTPQDDAFRLADALVLVPNRRAIPALIEAFAAAGHAGLLPAMRPLGDIEEDSEVWGPEPLDFDLAPAIDPLRRRLELARLVRARDHAEGGVADPARALAMADDLCRLLDSAAAGGGAVDWARLNDAVDQERFAAHWDKSLSFLSIVTQHWPQYLAAEGLADPAQRRHRVLEHLAARWRVHPPRGPVLILGSTGSVAGVRGLMRVVAGLEQGCVVLPGLDAELDDAAWDSIDAQHPQFSLKAALAVLGMSRHEIPVLGGESGAPQRAARRVLVREALAPADATADWLRRLEEAGGPAFAAMGAQGLTLIEAASQDEEANCVALLLREALESPGRTAALVTPDNGLARRVESKLARWGVTLSASGGRSLLESARGGLLALLVQLSVDEGDPCALAGLITHPLATFAMPAEVHAAQAQQLLAQLRGPRSHRGWDALVSRLEAGMELIASITAVLEDLRFVDAALVDLSDWAERLSNALVRCAGEAAFAEADGEALASLLRGLAEHGAAMGPCEAQSGARLIQALSRSQALAGESGNAPRLAIWGPLEARLQSRDLLILGGLNEGVWPAPPPEDGLLNRAMRAHLGLPPPEARLGLAAHDFAQLACAKEVVFTRAKRADGAPSVASRWLWRLLTLLKGAGIESVAPPLDCDPRLWAADLHAPQESRAAAPPQPRPPMAARPRAIAVTDVELLIRDPFAFYAKRILGLKPLDLIGIEPGPRERGIALHRAIELTPPGADSADLLAQMLNQLAGAGFPAERVLEERWRLALAARRFTDWRTHIEASGPRTWLEVPGALECEGFRVHGRADRIDAFEDGAHIVDYKTGQPPSDKEVVAGLAPQLCLEAAMLARGGFESVPVRPVKALIYWALSGKDPSARTVILKGSTQEAADAALAGFLRLMKAYANPDQPYLCKPRVKFALKRTEYDQLARRAEWSLAAP